MQTEQTGEQPQESKYDGQGMTPPLQSYESRKKQMQEILTDAERDEQGALYYAEKPFAVCRIAPDGAALPYLVDQHTWHRGTDALRSASDWMRETPGNRAIVYQRETGTVIAHYYQNPTGLRGCLLFSLQGEVVRSSNSHLFEQGQWQTTRPVLPSTFIPEASDLTLPWSAYRSARRDIISVDELVPDQHLLVTGLLRAGHGEFFRFPLREKE